MKFILHFVYMVVLGGATSSQVHFSVNNVGQYCEKINFDADDMKYEDIDREDNTIYLNWTAAFAKNNVPNFTILGCVQKLEINHDCDNIETCCDGGGQIKTTLTIWPNYEIEPVNISACENQKFVCLRFKTWHDPNWFKDMTRLEGLPSCKDDCNTLNWEGYKNMLNKYEIEGRYDNNTGQYKLDWVSGLEQFAGCLKETTLYYGGVSSKQKCCKGWKNTPPAHEPIEFTINNEDVCGDATWAFITYKKRTNEYKRHLKLKHVGECLEESATTLIVIGIIIGVVIIGLLFFCLFRYCKGYVDTVSPSVSTISVQ